MTHRSRARACGRRSSDEGGAAVVEFALVMPLVLVLVFGMLSGGVSYNRKLALTNAVREGSRFGSTLAVSQARTQGCTLAEDIDCWLDRVLTITEQAAEGEAGSSVSARRLCAAYVGPGDSTRSRLRTSAPNDVSTPGGKCFEDAWAVGEPRVQVSAQRDGKLELLLRSTNLTLSSRSVTRFEATPPS